MTKERNQQLLVLIRLLRSLYRELYRARPSDCGKPFQEKSLTRPQAELLFAVNKYKKGVTVKELASVLRVSSGAVTQLAGPLIEMGLLERHENPEDRRSVIITVKDRTNQDKLNFEAFYTAHVSPMFDALSDDELSRLIELIHKIKVRN